MSSPLVADLKEKIFF